jgi:hypothetical protein
VKHIPVGRANGTFHDLGTGVGGNAGETEFGFALDVGEIESFGSDGHEQCGEEVSCTAH